MESRVELFARIRRDARVEGLSVRALATRHGVHRRTVRQALESAAPPERKPRQGVSWRLEPFKAAIDAMLIEDTTAPRKQRHTARRILARLIEEHGAAELSYSTVRDYVRVRRAQIDVEAGRRVEVFVPQEHAPGAEAEVDFGELWVVLDGVKTKCHMFVFRLSHSGKAIQLASHEEPEAARALMGVFADEGIRVVRRAAVTSVRTDPAIAEIITTATVAGGQEEFRAVKLLVATGRRAVTDGLNLDAVGVKTGDAGQILVENTLVSSNPRIWAAGDVTGHREFVYVASAHGTLMVENAFNDAGREVDYRHLPRVAFTSPALAAVGMTEKKANEAGIRCECRVLPLEYVPRALVNRDTRGFIKIVADNSTGRIVGITAVGKEAGDLAAAGVYILEAGMTVDQVANLWSPYLTMAEGIKIAAQSFTTDVSKLSCCAS